MGSILVHNNNHLLTCLATFCVLVTTLLLNIASFNVVAASQEYVETNVYIVYMGERKHSDVDLITKSHHQMLASVLGSGEAAADSIIHSYGHGFSGFAAKMTDSQAQHFAELPGVIRVIPNRIYKVQTTRSWDFLGLSPKSSTPNLLQDSNQGDGVIIGVIDNGIWPESPSFLDKGIGKIPTKWKGKCESGQDFKPAKHCNKKVIGARYFYKGFLAGLNETIETFNATEYGEYLSARDGNGHGTHCASIAAGSFVSNVSIEGLARGTARGGAPKARLAIYKTTWGGSGSSADVLKAFDMAIHDGVDILSVSLGLTYPPTPEVDKQDLIYYGAFHAVANGITVVCSGGNSGPSHQTAEDVAPWVISVAASTIDRTFPTPISLGNNKKLAGQTMYTGNRTGFVDLVHGKKTPFVVQRGCDSITINDTWVAGKVVLCFNRGAEENIILALNSVYANGGLGIIAAADNIDFYSPDYITTIPVVLVTYDVGAQILTYMFTTKSPKVQILPTKTYTGHQVSTYIASFSSRGPNSQSPAVLKPDIAAPGVDILAAYTPGPRNTLGYAIESGTSMAAPHIAGIVALLKSLHPNWSPAAIKSALVTTAWIADPYTGEPIFAKAGMYKIADPFDYGGGLVNPNAARNPGLVYDMGTQDYIDYLCAMGYSEASINQLTMTGKSCRGSNKSVLDLNLPSITVPSLEDSVTITRTVTNVGDPNSTYDVIVEPPFGTSVQVDPMHLHFNAKVRKLSFKVTITTSHKVTTEYYFGSLTWRDKVHRVRIPVSVKTEFPQVYGN